MAFSLPDLPYDYNALDRAIDAQTMEIHHTKHHNTYVTKLNDAVSGTDHEGKALEDLLTGVSALPVGVRNNGGRSLQPFHVLADAVPERRRRPGRCRGRCHQRRLRIL